jgi:hypothetical protein
MKMMRDRAVPASLTEFVVHFAVDYMGDPEPAACCFPAAVEACWKRHMGRWARKQCSDILCWRSSVRCKPGFGAFVKIERIGEPEVQDCSGTHRRKNGAWRWGWMSERLAPVPEPSEPLCRLRSSGRRRMGVEGLGWEGDGRARSTSVKKRSQ